MPTHVLSYPLINTRRFPVKNKSGGTYTLPHSTYTLDNYPVAFTHGKNYYSSIRNRNDADNHLRTLRQLMPGADLKVIFEPPSPKL